jgi:hypothetical protein
MKFFYLVLFLPFFLFAGETIPKGSWEFISRYCTDCHDAEMNEGELNLDFKEIDWTSESVRKHWGDVYEMVDRQKMPPKKKKRQPTLEERQKFLSWLDQQMLMKNRIGGTPIRRLNKREFERTVQTLFGRSKYELPASFPKDNESHGFDTIAKDLVVSPSHIEAYREASIEIADYFFPPIQNKVTSQQWVIQPKDMTISYSSAYIVDKAMRLAATGIRSRCATWPTKFMAPVSAKYKVTLYLSTKNAPKGNTPEILMKAFPNGKKKNSERIIGKFKVQPGKVQKVTVDVNLYRGENLLFYYANSPYKFQSEDSIRNEFYKTPRLAAAWAKLGKKVVRGGLGWQRLKEEMANPNLDASKYKTGSPQMEKIIKTVFSKGVNSSETLVYKYFEEGPNIGIHQIKVDGPYKLVLGPEEKKQIDTQRSFLGDYKKTKDRDSLKRFLNSYLSKVFRRPATALEVDKYFSLVEQELRKGKRIDEGLHLVIRTSLLSPGFLYREQDLGNLSQYELASRLSYFLTSSAPDSKLMLKANSGTILNDQEYLKEVKRLLDNWSLQEFIQDFTSQWLDTKLLAGIMPDDSLFKKFKDKKLKQFKKFSNSQRQLMIDEVEMTFKEILTKNLPTSDFIDPNFIFTSKEIGEVIYRLDKSFSNKVKKYPIQRGSRYGGLLTASAVMMATANGVDTEPVLRGVWLLENIIGMPPPEPPKNVPALTPDTTGAKGPRERLAAHMSNASCASCHEDIDPMGFVLENFDALGKWRTHYSSTSKKKKSLKVDASGVLPNGTKFNDVTDLKKYLVSHPHYFANCLAKKLMTYATGRVLNYLENKLIEDIVAKNISKGQGFKDLFIDLTTSKVFKTR